MFDRAARATVTRVLGRRSPKLHLCPVCGSESVSRWLRDDLEDGMRARLLLSCGECDTSRELVATIWAVDAYSRRHERQQWQIAVALKRVERARMANDLRVLVEALDRDLIGADDFT
jgi:transcription elongation factor Elf1